MHSDKVENQEFLFDFGANWKNYIKKHFSETRLKLAREHLLEFIQLSDLKGFTFLDVGCGSGIHSLAAYASDADRIVSFDINLKSIECALALRSSCSISANRWEICQGSILDEAFCEGLPKSNLVYSWGVLHHTGNVWKAIANTLGLVLPSGMLYLALYQQNAKSEYWAQEKKKYVKSSFLGKKFMELSYVYGLLFKDKSPSQILKSIKYVYTYQKSRGMEFWTDVRDWLGGLPYEPVEPDRVVEFVVSSGFELVRLSRRAANAEFLFKRRETANS